jgi:Ca2+-binding RTX toxin-like protein
MDGGAGRDLLSIRGDVQLSNGLSARFGFEDVELQAGAQLRGGLGADVFNFAGVEVVGLLKLAAGEGADTLTGSSRSDSLSGEGGEDRLDGRDGDDSLDGGEGRDQLAGGLGADVLNGGLRSDRLLGGEGEDLLVGGGGADTLTGGLGPDRFVFLTSFDSLRTAMDRITDFDLADGDRIDLSAVDADVFTAGDQAFVVVAGFTETAGEVRLIQDLARGRTTLEADVNGDAVADLVVRVDSLLTEAGLVL